MKKLELAMLVEVELNYTTVMGLVSKLSDNDMFYVLDQNGTEWKFYQSINPVKVIRVPLAEHEVDVNDFHEYPMVMKVGHAMGSTVYVVGGFSEQDCLDAYVDYHESMENYGMFITHEELEEDGLEEDGLIVAGNHCHYLDSSYLAIIQYCELEELGVDK